MDERERRKIIIDALSDEIAETLRSLESERHWPGENPDRMDEKLKALEKRSLDLRVIRNQLESLFAVPAL